MVLRLSGRYRPAVVAGVTALSLTASGGCLFSFEQGMSEEEIDQATAEILESAQPGYLVGDEADGHSLGEMYLDGDWGVSRVTVGYGSSCEAGGEAGCSSDVYIWTSSMAEDYLRAYDCERLEPVLGAPTVKLDHLVVFTGVSMVTIAIDEFARNPDIDKERELAEQLRPVGETAPLEQLPAPTAEISALVDEVCGPTPSG